MEDKELGGKNNLLRFNQTLEGGHSIGLGGRGRRGSTADQKHSHAGFGLIDFGEADASCSMKTGR